MVLIHKGVPIDVTKFQARIILNEYISGKKPEDAIETAKKISSKGKEKHDN